MRGKAGDGKRTVADNRITPAYAGKSIGDIVGQLFGGDHPRICGEKPEMENGQSPTIGSPPHMRGKAGTASSTPTSARITPAYAGKSDQHRRVAGKVEDHPRICGEKKSFRACKSVERGSPPHMRGKGDIAHLDGVVPRITPAYAGKRRGQRDLHPQLRGSPPHMRGKAKTSPPFSFRIGITPAYAGKSVYTSNFSLDS